MFTEGCEYEKELRPSLSKCSQCESVVGGLLDCSTRGGCHCFSKDVKEYGRLMKDTDDKTKCADYIFTRCCKVGYNNATERLCYLFFLSLSLLFREKKFKNQNKFKIQIPYDSHK